MDGDGFGDNQTGKNPDAFPTDAAAALDADGDGYPDQWNMGKTEEDSITDLTLDAFPEEPTQWADRDEDGYGDNPNGTDGDLFPTDKYEWADSDGDGYGDNMEDKYPNDPTRHIDLVSTGGSKNESDSNMLMTIILVAVAIVVLGAIIFGIVILIRRRSYKKGLNVDSFFVDDRKSVDELQKEEYNPESWKDEASDFMLGDEDEYPDYGDEYDDKW